MFIFLVLHTANTLCVNTTNVKHPVKTEVKSNNLPFCMEHSTRTCCDPSSALTIYKKFYRTFNDPPIYEDYNGYSNACMQYSQRIMCSECDGDFGEGLIISICLDLCDKWYSACENDYFVSNSKDIEFCTGNSLICFKLSEIVQSGTHLCQNFGFQVQDSECYDGTPSSIKKGSVLPSNNSALTSYVLLFSLILLLSILFYFYLKQKVSKHNFDIREARLKRFNNS